MPWIPAAAGAAASIYGAIRGGGGGGAPGSWYASANQHLLPAALRYGPSPGHYGEGTDKILEQGIAGIGELIKHPGQLSPDVADAIRQQLAMTSEGIAGNFRGIRSQQTGALARSNAPMSLKGALGSALDVAQERAQRDARRGALSDSDQLRRQDLGQTYALLDVINQIMLGGKGIAVQASSAANAARANTQATAMAGLGSLSDNLSNYYGGRNSGTTVNIATPPPGSTAGPAPWGGVPTGGNTFGL